MLLQQLGCSPVLLQAPEVQAVIIQQCHQLALQNHTTCFFQNASIKYNTVNLAVELLLFIIPC